VLTADHVLARELAIEAGSRLLALRAGGGDPAALRAAGDRLSHEYLIAELARQRPADAVLSEEGTDDASRLAARRVWIIDPLDGTREFGESGRTDWAVHVALWDAGELTAGAVALPALSRALSTGPGGVAGSGSSTPMEPLRMLVSRSRPPEFVQRLAESLGADLVPLGSAGAKAAAVIAGDADAYVHSGGQYEWDSAAPVAVALSAGLHASRVDGSKLEYNQPSPYVPDLLICRQALAPRILLAIAATQTAR
jgi:3'(2'), 5'-bisphosphate nucleotidase